MLGEHKNRTWVWLTLIVVLAAVLRFYGIDFGDPYIYHPDETKLVSQAGRLLDTKFMDKDAYFGIRVYPPFYTYMLAFVMAGYIGVNLITGRFESLEAVKLAYENDSFQFVLLSRSLVAVMGVGLVLLIYVIAVRLYSKKIGLISAILVATNFLLVRNSHFGTVDIPVAFFAAASVYFCIAVMQKGRIRDYVLSALFIALVTATKFSMALLVLPLIFAHFSRYSMKEWGRALLDKKLWFAAFSGFVFFLIACPIIWLDFQETWGGILGTTRFESAGKVGSGGGLLSYWTGNQSAGFGVFYPNSIPELFGVVLTVIAAVSLFYILARRTKSEFLLLVVIVPVYLLFEKMSIKAMRHILPIIPILLLTAAVFMSDLIDRIKNKNIRWIALSALMLFFAISQSGRAVSYQKKLTDIDPRTKATAWVQQNLPPNAPIAVESFPPYIVAADSVNYEIYETRWASRSKTREKEFRAFVATHDSVYYIADDFTRQVFSWKFTREKYPDITRERLAFFEELDAEERLVVFQSKNEWIQPTVTIFLLTVENTTDGKNINTNVLSH